MAHVFEDIAELIVTRLQAGTYTAPYELKEIVRPARLGTGFQFEHLKCVVLQDPPQQNSDITLPGNPPAPGWTVPYRVEVFIQPSTTNPNQEPLQTICNAVLAQVITALTTPNDAWHTWNNKAVNTLYESSVVQNDDGSIVTARVVLNVDCRHNEGDPTTAR
jgi:hypothetical protein